MKVTTKILSDFLKKTQFLYRVQQNRISYKELIEFMYKETPPENHNFLIYNYTPYIEKVKKSGLDEKKSPLFSVIIATYNRRELLKKALEAIARQKEISAKDMEIVIADNGSIDKTEEMIANFQKNGISIVYIQLKKNYGADLARNIAVLNSRGSFLAFTDDDCIVPPDWLIEFKKELEADPKIAGVGGFKEPRPIKNHLDIYHRFLMWKHFYSPHIRTKEFDLSRNHCGLTANV
ncbi:MAG: glycosyltransferase family A protein, partial [bacterium]|nr:glycosyltransferase family A protein [bacterium]